MVGSYLLVSTSFLCMGKRKVSIRLWKNRIFFKDIAMTKHPIGENDREVEPLHFPKQYFVKTAEEFPYGKVTFRQDISYQERTETMQQELKELKAHYLPYMSDFLPNQEQPYKQELKEFEFRYLGENEIFTERNREDVQWERVVIPDYRGPAQEDGKWRAYYRTSFSANTADRNKRVIIRFQCVDYKALIYVNGNYAGGHEGFFAPFELDITNYLKENNELVIECHNDYTILGTGPVLDGDKIYAATGPGWDDPDTGWHHCPAGAGVFGKVTVEYRPLLYINDIFVRPDIDKDYCELRIGIMNYGDKVEEGFELEVDLMPKNYEGASIGSLNAVIHYVGIGKNEYRYLINTSDYRLWEPDSPYLYGAVLALRQSGRAVSHRTGTFGMKKFVSDETSTPKGKFYFNNRPFVLRGANEMGHLQQCVMKGDFELLIEDILIAKLCNLNYYRVTQRPVQEEIYDYFDMLGMMHQCDFPLFSFLRRPQFSEAIKQVTEMEHLIRGHVSTVMVTFINEPMRIRRTEDPNDKYSKRYEAKGHRHLLRDELEAFFAAARKAIYVENPDRVIKNVEGDYDSPTAEGMPDFHTYTMWYTNHGEPIGRLLKGYLPPVKTGWMIGCGEYGAEGLDNLNIILEKYPKEWLTLREDGSWLPDKIRSAQTHSVHGDWYQEQSTIEAWVQESQKHQAAATKLMTDTFRRRADVMNQTAIHLLIDAWPSGWMKTLVCCDRMPKPAYFAYRDSLEPLRINLYSDRRYVYAGELLEVEAWLLNDLPEEKELTVMAALRLEGKGGCVYRRIDKVGAAASNCVGCIPLEFPEVDKETIASLDACILDENGVVLNEERLEFYVYPSLKDNAITDSVSVKGEMADALGIYYNLKRSEDETVKTALVSDTSEQSLKWLGSHLRKGGRAVLLLPEDGVQELSVEGISISTSPCTEVFFAASRPEYQKYHFNMTYNHQLDYIDYIGKQTIQCSQEGDNLVYTYAKSGFQGNDGRKPELPFVKKLQVGSGELIIISLLLKGKIGYNPNLEAFLLDLLKITPERNYL